MNGYMSRRTTHSNKLMVESISETSIDMTGREPSKAENEEKSWPPLERGEWPLIDYDLSEVKSAQELLFEVICIYLTSK